MTIDSYKTIGNNSYYELIEKGSKFIAYIYHIDNEDKFRKNLSILKIKYPDATHHCTAFKLRDGTNTIIRFNDDGEPSGSAGRPILNVLEGSEATNIMCVVVRYFGGTKLGVGGLIRAYSAATNEALSKCKILTKYLTKEIKISFPYDFTGGIENFIDENNISIVKREFNETSSMICSVRQNSVTEFTKKISDITNGKAEFSEL